MVEKVWVWEKENIDAMSPVSPCTPEIQLKDSDKFLPSNSQLQTITKCSFIYKLLPLHIPISFTFDCHCLQYYDLKLFIYLDLLDYNSKKVGNLSYFSLYFLQTYV